MPTRSEVLSALQEAAIDVLGKDDAPELTEDFSLGDGADIDSLDLIEIVMVLEETYGIALDANDLEDVTTIGGVIDVLVTKIPTSA